jgi:centromere protein I
MIYPTVLAFLREYLSIWDGRENVDSILGLLSYISIESFHETYATYLAPAENAVASHIPSSYSKLVDFYTSLLQHQLAVANPGNARLIKPALESLTTHVATLSTSILLSLPPSTNSDLVSSIISFYELLSTSTKPRVVPIMLPPMHLVYLLAQGTSSTAFSRICGILGAYKFAFDRHPKPVKDHYPASTTDSFNSCLRDIYNLVWVARAFNIAEQKSVGLYCDPALRAELNDYLSGLDREYAIGTAFGLSNNPWLASSAAAVWRAVEEREIEKEGYDRSSIRYHQGPVSQRSLESLKRKGGVSIEWDGAEGYKVFVIQWLGQRGLDGIKDLMFATVTNLKGKA